MPDRAKHPRPDFENLLKEIEDLGWQVEERETCFICKCTCLAHMRSVSRNPKGTRALLNTRKWFERQACWRREGAKGEISPADAPGCDEERDRQPHHH